MASGSSSARQSSGSWSGTSTSFEKSCATYCSIWRSSASTVLGISSSRSASGFRVAIERADRVRHLPVRVEEHGAEVLRIDRAPGLGCCGFDHRPALGADLRSRERRQPAVAEPPHPTELAGRPAAEPDVGRLLHGLGQHPQPLVVEAGPVVVDRVLRPEPAHQRERFVEPRGAVLAGDAERLLLGRVHDPQAEPGEEPPAGEHVEARELLGEQRGVAAGQDLHAGSELELPGPAGGDREPDDRIGRVAAHPLREPQRVEPQRFERVDQLIEPVGLQPALRAEPVPDPNLHCARYASYLRSSRRAICCLWTSSGPSTRCSVRAWVYISASGQS